MTWLSDLTLILPDRVIERGSLRLDGPSIAEIAEAPIPGGLPCDGLECFAGFVDMHGDMIEHELEPRPGVDFPVDVAFAHLDARLAATGVTTAYASVSFSRGRKDGATRSYAHTSRTIRAVAEGRAGRRVDHKVHARFDVTFEGAVDVIAELIAAGTVDLVSLMDHTPGQGQYRNLEGFIARRAEEDGTTLEEARAAVEARIRDGQVPEGQLMATLRAVSDLCRAHAVPMASHDDDTVQKAALMASLGCAISEFPVTPEAAAEAKARGMVVAMGAPNAMRGESYSGNLSARAAHAAGHLGILAADYHPGAILPAIRVLAGTDPDGLPGAARLASAHPAGALGLTDRGRIAPGLRADLALAAPDGPVVATWVAGRCVHDDGTLPRRAETFIQPARGIA
ncbi:MAG: alpha-D-ribose 1-methylphosphonate 5-triphosphate diphosphatase [Pseudomonadota bacterium]